MTIFTVQLSTSPDPLERMAVALLTREIATRAEVSVHEVTVAANLILVRETGIGAEGYRIGGEPCGAVRITGNDSRGLLYGIGKFLHSSTYTPGNFTPSAWRGVSVPHCAVRGMYFASHFFNFYHSAPVAEIERYVEALALWGCNTLSVWFDMHHYQGINDPAAQAMISRLRTILQAGNRVGMKTSITAIANEGYADSPEELRAEWVGGQNGYHTGPYGHYHCEVCPSKPGGMEYILRTRRELLAAFADLDIGYHWLWPYDQGACTCAKCAPWGAKGYLRTAEALAPLIKEYAPDAEVVLSSWYFEKFIDGEWADFDRAVQANRPSWLHYLIADSADDQFPPYILEHGVPGGAKLLNFPEISMTWMGPWGGYGASPLPMRLQKMWESVGDHLAGGFPYSEGIYEDINKVINLQHYWDGRHAVETVREYVNYEFSSEAAEDITAVVLGIEQCHNRDIVLERDPTLRETLYLDSDTAPAPYHVHELSGAAERFARLQQVEAAMSSHARTAWRWRLLILRAAIDAEIQRTAGHCSAQLDEYFEELTRIYHAENAYWSVCPPSRRKMLHFFVQGEIDQQ